MLKIILCHRLLDVVRFLARFSHVPWCLMLGCTGKSEFGSTSGKFGFPNGFGLHRLYGSDIGVRYVLTIHQHNAVVLGTKSAVTL